MPDPSSAVNPLDHLAEDFVERYRRGEKPALTEYIRRNPELESEIRDLFPGLVLMEGIRPEAGEATGALSALPSECKHPERIGDYRILREVGRGGMGIVYEAEQESLGRHVALKVLPPHGLLNSTFLERFRRESKAAAKLHHTNIVPVFGVGEYQGFHYYAMQFIRGEALDKVLHDLRGLCEPRTLEANQAKSTASGQHESVAASLLTGSFGVDPALSDDAAHTRRMALPPTPASKTAGFMEPSSALSPDGSGANYHRSVARIGLQVADALAYAHRQGVLHRDVKPSNLLLDTQGILWITDFGLAKDVSGVSDLTQTGDIVGTVRFMAPERFDGQSLPQSDVYGLGVTLYELVTLRPAFDDTNKARLVENVVHKLPVPPRTINPAIPRDLETIVLKCLAKEPLARYASAEALADDLRRFLADRPIKARRASNTERLWRWCRRNPTVSALCAMLLSLLLVIALGGVAISLRLGDALGQARHDRDQAQSDRDNARTAQREGREKLLLSLIAEARAQRLSRRVGQRCGTLRTISEAVMLARELDKSAETMAELRNLAISALALQI
ncbi:MAG: serine/threonine-protein kinase [Gemmataceae bacterium]